MIKNNIGYKLLALAIAIVIWLYVNDLQPTNDVPLHKNTYITRHFSVPLEVRKADRNFSVSGAPREIDLMLEGRQDDMRALVEQKDEISAYISLLGRGAGTHTLPVIIRLPEEFSGLIRKSAETQLVTVVLEEKARRELKIDAELIGKQAENLNYALPEITPGRANVYGPSKSIEAVKRLVVKADIAGAGVSGIDEALSVSAIDSNGAPVSGVDIVPHSVHLRVVPLKASGTKSVFVSVSAVGQPPYPLRVTDIEVRPQMLLVTGDQSKLASIEMLGTEPLQLSNRKQTFTQRLRVISPTGVTVSEDGVVDVMVKLSASTKSSDGNPESGSQPKTGNGVPQTR